MTHYRVLSYSIDAEQVIKRSRFIALGARVADIAAARSFIQQVRDQHPQARHVCSAFVAGAPSDPHVLGFSDDGEPSGTAGRPILAVLQGAGVGEICVAVVRYSGGTKLGTGGLVRAYGGTAQLAMQNAQWSEVAPQVTVTLNFAYALNGLVEQLITKQQGRIIEAQFTDRVFMSVMVPQSNLPNLQRQLIESSAGTIECVVLDKLAN